MVCLDETTLLEFAQGRIPPDQLAELDEHLDRCADCRRTLAAYGQQHPAETDGGAPEPVLRHGEKLGRYVILDAIGCGGMGTVLAAHDPVLDRRVAIKLLRTGSRLSQSRVLREAQAMARLSHHPNVLTVYDVGAADRRVFIAMELVDGITLRSWLAARPSWRDIVRVFAEAGAGLSAAHEAGLVHRDFKPDNVLVADDGRVLVMDFGLVRLAAGSDRAGPLRDVEWTLTGEGVLLGTPAYMAPEQLSGSAADARSDQFAFCVALHEAIYGARPFPGQTVDERSAAMAQGLRARPDRRGFPAWLAATVARGLSDRPADRFPDMRALLAVLDRHQAGRRRVAITVVVAMVCALGLGVAWLAMD